MFKLSVAAALVAAFSAAPYYYRKAFYRVEEEVRSRVEATFAQRMPHLHVSVKSAHLTAEGIKVQGLSFAERDATGPQPELVFVDEMLLACRTSPQELMSGEPLITAITLRRPVVRGTRRPDGSFNLSKLFPLPQLNRPVPTTIESGNFEIFDPLKNPSSTLTFRDVNLSIRPEEQTDARIMMAVEGWLSGDHVRRVELSGSLWPDTGGWQLKGTVDDLEISPELRRDLPQALADPMAAIAAVRAPADLSFHVRADAAGQMPSYEVNGQVSRGRIDDSQLPFPLTDLTARFHCDNSRLEISELSMRHGPTIWEVAYLNYTADSPLELQASGRQVRLDRALGAALPEPWRKNYQNYDPQGEVNVNCTLRYEQNRWRPIVARVDGVNNVSFSCFKFPYRLENAAGSLTLRDNILYVDITAYSGPQPVKLDGRFHNPGPNFTGSIDIQGRNIPFDEKLFAALSVKPRANETVRSLRPQGNFDFQTRVWRNDPSQKLVHQDAAIDLNGCGMNFQKFPYPLSNVRGRLLVHDGHWTFFQPLTGNNASGTVLCTGELKTAGEKDTLAISLEGRNVPLSEDLRKALRPNEQQLWDTLRPRGNVDFRAQVGYDSISKKTAIDLRVYPRGDATSIGTSIEPVAFPYRFENLKGCVRYRDDHVDIEHMQADHRNTVLATDGFCDLQPDGGWRLHLENLKIDRIYLQGADHDLMSALPETLRRAIVELRPSGPLNLRGNLDFAKRSPTAPLATGWDVDLYLHQMGLQAGPKLEGISGRMHLEGAAQGGRFWSEGYLFLDSVTFKNLQFTDVLGPLWFNNEFVYLGSPPGTQNSRPPRRITAKVCDGIVAGDCQIVLGNVPQYWLLANLAGADLAQLARENLASHPKLKGKVSAQLDLRGTRGPQSLQGNGTLQLSEADIYELPVMLSMLKLMRAKPPDATAFTQSDVDFQIRGEHLTFPRIELHGDAISLRGSGELTLDGMTNPINLALHTAVGRGTMPLLSGMFSEASQQIMIIHVEGPLDKPQTRKEPFPGLAQALEGSRPAGEVEPGAGKIMRGLGGRR